MALAAIRDLFWFTRERPDLEQKHTALQRLMNGVMAERARTTAERLTRPTVPEMYAGRSVLVTGGSGFMGRVLVEALLRCCPDVGHVYVILRAKKGVSPRDRLHALTDVPLFDRLRAEQPGALDKLVVLPGDMAALGLGLSQEHRDLVQRDVAFVYHLAASIRFDDPFQKAVFTNLRSGRELLDLARGMSHLKALVHVSTAYTNINHNPAENKVYQPEHDWRDVIDWAERLDEDSLVAINNLGDKLMGFQPNTYLFTKALAEKMMEDASRELPIIVTRPSIVSPSMTDPIPGWIDNIFGMASLWAAILKGLFYTGYNISFRQDAIPVDSATKIIVLASWSRALGIRLCDGVGVDVVTVALGSEVAMSSEEFTWLITDDGVAPMVPFPNPIRTPYFGTTKCWVWYQMQHWYHHLLFGALLDLLARATGRKPRVLKLYRIMVRTLQALDPVRGTFNFQTDKAWKLQSLMHPDDEKDFGIDGVRFLKGLESVESFRDMTVPILRGVLTYALKEQDDPVENAKHMARIRWVIRLYHLTMAVVFYLLVIGCFKLRAFLRHVPLAATDTLTPYSTTPPTPLSRLHV